MDDDLMSQSSQVSKGIFIYFIKAEDDLIIDILTYKAACVSEWVRPSDHLVPGTNSEIEGLT